MRVRLLGPVELEVDQRPLAVGGPRAQAVLAILAVRAGEVLTADWLIDQVWGERPPPAARASLQAYVSRLRAGGPPHTRDLLPRHPRGYLVDPRAGEIDARRYRWLSAQSRAAAATGRWRDTLGHLDDAARLWRGDPFTGIDAPALSAERDRLVELRRSNHVTDLQARLEVTGAAEVIGPLRGLVASDPWDERAWQLLMLALYRGDRQAEALDAARRARGLLAGERGLDPSPALAQLERRILRHDPSLSAPAGVRTPA
jgi:DNA-binding SARP family transcriptional activator